MTDFLIGEFRQLKKLEKIADCNKCAKMGKIRGCRGNQMLVARRNLQENNANLGMFHSIT